MIDLEPRLKDEARTLGFCLVGIAKATEADHFDDYQAWLEAGNHGAMAYLADQGQARRHPDSILTDVRSVIVVGMEDSVPSKDDPSPHWILADGPNSGRVARFALGRDYHQAIWRRLDRLQSWLKSTVLGCRTRGVSDTAPLLERDFARRAGLGWVGKNTMLINKHRGSYIMLGAVLTDTDLNPDEPHRANHCGTCTACLTACPTDAFPEPGVLDARKCISYLNIEVKGSHTDEQRQMIGDWLYGCDICQDVCPWNRKSVTETATVDARDLLTLTNVEFKDLFRKTVADRIHRRGLARNAAIVLGNRGNRDALPALNCALHDDDSDVRSTAAWAIGQIEKRVPSC
jgi:epoxyqueuosine reductase